MKIASLTNERREIIRALEEATGIKAKYLGAPSFGYEVGPYTVDRAGDIFTENAGFDVLSPLIAKGLIERFDDEGIRPVTTISLPMEGFDGRSLKNLVFLINSKSVLLSKAIAWPRFYHISEKLITELDEGTPESAEDFLQIITAAGEGAINGFAFDEEQVNLFFPNTADPNYLQTFMQLTELMAKMAKEQKRVQPTKCKDTNEKYTFRVWLLRLGMKGDEYKTARKLLLKNLKGHVAFRTKDQADAAKEKLKTQRAAEREAASEMAFEEL